MKSIFKKIIGYILRLEASLILKKYKPIVVAITGSIGKTSTKDAVYAVLSKFYFVRKSEKSFNSEIGLPLTILGRPNGWNNPVAWSSNILRGLWLLIYPHKYPECLVLEAGVGKPGDMKMISSWLKSDVVIITKFGHTPPHIEFFNSVSHLIEEKSLLIDTLKKDGLLVLNADDEAVIALKDRTKTRSITYGFSEKADVIGSNAKILYSELEPLAPKGIIFRADYEGNSLPVSIEGALGKNHIYAALSALAVSFGQKLNVLESIEALRSYELPPGRMRIIRGISDSLVIDDTYNSSPVACESALETLFEMGSSSRKIAVLGDMLELGKHTEESHKKIGEAVNGKVDFLLTVGMRAKFIKEGALSSGMDPKNIFEFENSSQAGEFIIDFLQKGDICLIKGSQGIRMERAVEQVIFDKENKDNLLVRQDKEWKKR